MSKNVSNFLRRFHIGDQNIDTVFLYGCCYWFAVILMERFKDKHPSLMIDVAQNHFGVMIDGAVYDISGDVTDQYEWESWDSQNDDLYIRSVENDCINF